MEKTFRISIDTTKPNALRAEMQVAKAEGRTVITIALTIPNEIATQTIAAAQAEVLRLAIEDLQTEREALLSAT